jgi:hypothetical protein
VQVSVVTNDDMHRMLQRVTEFCNLAGSFEKTTLLLLQQQRIHSAQAPYLVQRGPGFTDFCRARPGSGPCQAQDQARHAVELHTGALVGAITHALSCYESMYYVHPQEAARIDSPRLVHSLHCAYLHHRLDHDLTHHLTIGSQAHGSVRQGSTQAPLADRQRRSRK